LQQLRVLASVAAVHRTAIPLSDSVDSSSGAATTPQTWGPLTLYERIGVGAFGEVFRAWDDRLDREVALKLLRPSSSGTFDHATASIDEGRLLARVRHPNVVQVYGAERIVGRVGFWTEFIRGSTLGEFVRRHGRFSAQEAIAVGVDLARALSAVHRAGLLHRDIKPQNVMREDGGRIVLMDFGAGRERLEETIGGVNDLTGTPLYLAPELWQRAEATVRSDIYSLGVLLYYLVTETHPVRGKSGVEVRDAQAAGRRVLLRDERPDLPEPFVEVVERAIAADPNARFESAGALEAALRGAQHPADPRSEVSPGEDRVVPGRQTARARCVFVLPFAGLAGAALALLVVADVGGLRGRLFGPRPGTALAVLPVENLTRDPSLDIIADGLTDDLITQLVRIGGPLRVPSYHSVQRYKGAKQPLDEIGRALGVQTVLEAFLTRDQGRSRLGFRLYRILPEVALTQGQYELPAASNSIARDVVGTLQLALTNEERTRLAEQRTVDPRAFMALTEGRALFHGGTDAGRKRADQLLGEAIASQPDYAEAYAYRALLWVHGGTSLRGSGLEKRQKSRASAEQALALDPRSVEAHTALGWAELTDWDWRGAEREFREAIALNPNFPMARTWYAQYLSAMCRSEEAFVQGELAIEQAGREPSALIHAVYPYYEAGPPYLDKAVKVWREVLERTPQYWGAHQSIARAYLMQGKPHEALREFQNSATLRNGGALQPSDLGLQAVAYGMTGRRDEALRIASDLERRSIAGEANVPRTWIALAFLGAGDRQAAMHWLVQAYERGRERGGEGMFFLRSDPLFAPLGDLPELRDLIRRIFDPVGDPPSITPILKPPSSSGLAWGCR
jgi:serine/threonine-protein kinase